MHKANLLLSLLVVSFAVTTAIMSLRQADADDTNKGRLLRHVVLFKFKPEASEAQVQAVVDAFAALPKKIKQIQDFEWGTDVSVENKAAGFTHGFVVTFESKEARDEYLPHPAHKEFVSLVGPSVENVLVFDYWANR